MSADYSLYYAHYHPDTPEHLEAHTSWLRGWLDPLVGNDFKSPALDIGCGFGYALLALRRTGFEQVSGIELSPQQAERARKQGLEITVTDDTTAEVGKHRDKFGVVLLLDVLEHVPKEVQVSLLKAIHQSLKPGGRLVVSVPNSSSILATRWRYNDYTHHTSFTEVSLRVVLREAGFDDVFIDNQKGLGRLPKWIWLRKERVALRRWLIRWFWLQVHRAELGADDIGAISLELNLHAVAKKSP